jgi:hypothetical protein
MSSSSMSRRDGGVYRRAGLTVALALAALAALPAIASAGVVSTGGTGGAVITYTGDGSADTVTVTNPAADTYNIAEAGISETSANCVDNGNDVTCSGVAWTSVTANIGGGDDVFTAAGVNDDPFSISGQSGNDNLTASSASDTVNGGDDPDTNGAGLSGGPGADTLLGGSGADEMNGNAGADALTGEADGDTINGDADNDTLNGNAGQDVFNGGTGTDRMEGGLDGDDFTGGDGIDRVLYVTGCSQGVTVTIDNSPNDIGCNGDSSENVRDTVESITGSTFGDTITGSCSANTFAGDPGSASGNPGGNDTLNGDPNTCAGGNGADFMGGGEGNDIFNGDGTTGAAGFDTVTYGSPYTGGTGISVTLDDAGPGTAANDNDGFGNVDENVNGDIERVIGSSSGDTIDATAADQGVNLFGRATGDTLTGSGFSDFLDGEGGVDSLTCLGGLDTYRDNENEDTIAADCETEI